MGSKKRVFILGAGCSFDGEHGYPLATGFIPALERCSSNIAGKSDCRQIKTAVDDTVALLKISNSRPWHAATVDQLVDAIFKGRCDNEIGGANHRYHVARKARIATAACFLGLEPIARQRQLNKYRRFISGRILSNTGGSSYTAQRLKESNACVLTFNYDRLFELAFFATFSDASTERFGPYSDQILNTGLTVSGDLMPIDPDRFSFLKMHGSIGMFSGEDMFPEQIRSFDAVDRWATPEFSDALFFAESSTFQREPLIVFPFEKDFIVSGREHAFSFGKYIDQVWNHAAEAIRFASEIWVIGYSFDPTDSMHLISRMKQAKACSRIVIQNLPSECDRIRAMLEIEHQFDIPITTHHDPF